MPTEKQTGGQIEAFSDVTKLETTIEENVLEETTMEDMMDEIEKSMIHIRQGDIIKGIVLDVTEEEVIVNIGYGADGIVPKADLVDDDQVSLKDVIQIGEEIEVYVEKVDDGEGNVLLSKQRADAVVVWEELEEFQEKEQAFEVKVKEVVKGGVVANFRGVRAFIPASLLSYQYVEDLNEWVGKTLKVQVEELDVEKRKVVLSRKAVELLEKEEKKKELFATIKRGEKRKGIVQRLMNYGAFVDLGGVDGLIHISDLAWTRVKHPSDVLTVGDEVEVRVVDFDPVKQKISLALKDVKEDPWDQVMNMYKINEIVTGKVVRLLDFGAFVQLDSGVEGLVHISQISEKHIAKPSEVLSVGDEVKVKILEINSKDKRMSLSIKEVTESFDDALLDYIDNDSHTATIGDLLKGKFKGL
ncbi:MAG: 30S ribosomal protein S1 [Epulopiscium sp.]|nr:30S ribosomal protein S1 [Candidatus Epulonipiscium sp.]